VTSFTKRNLPQSTVHIFYFNSTLFICLKFVLTEIHKLHQIDSTSLYLLFQRNFTSLNVINYQDFHYGIALPDIHLDLVFINDVLICQTLCPMHLLKQIYI
jgi:hypothetical protein